MSQELQRVVSEHSSIDEHSNYHHPTNSHPIPTKSAGLWDPSFATPSLATQSLPNSCVLLLGPLGWVLELLDPLEQLEPLQMVHWLLELLVGLVRWPLVGPLLLELLEPLEQLESLQMVHWLLELLEPQ